MAVPIASWGEVIRGLRLGAALDRDGYNLGEPIDLTVALRNEGREGVMVVESHLLWEYRFAVTLDGYGSIAMSERARALVDDLESWYSGARRTIEIPPGAVHELPWKAPLHEWFEVHRPGRYTVEAQRNDWRDGERLLTSGIVAFDVT